MKFSINWLFCLYRLNQHRSWTVYWIFTKLGHIIPLWKGKKNPIYFGVITIISFDNLYRRAYFVMHTFLVLVWFRFVSALSCFVSVVSRLVSVSFLVLQSPFPKDECFILVLFKWLEKNKCLWPMFFFIIDQKLEVKYHRYLTGSLFKKVTKKLDTGEIQILFPDGIICGWKLINSDKIFIS